MAVTAPTTQAWREVLALFDRWADADEAARDHELRRIEAEHPALYPRLLAMIEADRAAEARDFLAQAAPLPVEAPPASHVAGMQLGAWALRETIGSGGMGQVWLATRSDGLYNGRAAVKLLHATRLDPQAQARFAREGEFVARLTHPHIAQLLDAGLAPDGTRYLVLEYVPGERIDLWCDARQLGIEARLRLFMQVCEAVAYAHSHLVVHRDLKPANILVTGEGHVKLLDFGVAKLLAEDDDAQQTELTRAAPAGLTPEYAAPEQIEGQPITTATDVYALGVILFGLLSGARPYGSTSRGVAALARAIVEEPPRSLTAALRESPDAGLSRGASIASLRQALRGDLETIVAKALKKSPGERYATVQELREDVQRHLDHQPVSAQPDTFAYRARKFAQRNRVQVLALSGLMVTLVLGIVATTWQWQTAKREAQRTQSVVKVLTDIFSELTPDESDKAQISVLELLRKGWKRVESGFESDPALQAEVAHPLGLMLRSSGDMTSAVKALTMSRAHLRNTGQTHNVEYLTLLQALAYAQLRVGQTQEAKVLLEETIATSQAMRDTTSIEPLQARIQLGEIARREGRLHDAHQQLREVVELTRKRLGPSHSLYRLALQEHAEVLRDLGQWKEAKHLLEAASNSAQGAPRHESLLARFEVAKLNVELGNYREASAQLRAISREMATVYGDGDTFTIYSGTWLSMALFHSGEFAESDAISAAVYKAAQDSTEPFVRQTVQNLIARQLLRRARWKEAEPLLRDNLQHYEAGDATNRPAAQRTRALMAEGQLRAGNPSAALQMLDAVLASQRQISAFRNLDLWPTMLLRALALDALSGINAARSSYEDAATQALSDLPAEHPDRLRIAIYRDQSRWRSSGEAKDRTALETSLRAYSAALAQRPDHTGISVLSDKLLAQGPAAQFSLEPLLELLTY
jgi:serine/threonine protein kinase